MKINKILFSIFFSLTVFFIIYSLSNSINSLSISDNNRKKEIQSNHSQISTEGQKSIRSGNINKTKSEIDKAGITPKEAMFWREI